MSQERRLDDENSAEIKPSAPSAPGRSPVTARLSPRPLIFRVESAEAARELGSAFGRRDGNGVAAGADSYVQRAASASSGSALPSGVKDQFESSLGADLSGVRVHTGSASAEAASAVGARAYTTGQDIHFGAGQYAPSDPFGLHLLAHEVAHTVQQAGGASSGTQYKLEVSTPGDHAEVEADRAADAMVAGRAASVSGGGGIARTVMRDAKNKNAPTPAPAGPHTLTAAEKTEANNLRYDAMAAKAYFNAALGAMSPYKTQVPGALKSLKASYKTTETWANNAYDTVKDVIAESAEFEAWKKEIAMAVIGGIFAGVGGGMAALGEAGEATTAAAELEELPLPTHALTDSKSYFELAKAGKEELLEAGKEGYEKVSEGVDKAKEANPAITDLGATPDQGKAAFYEQLASLESIGNDQIIPLYDSLAKLGEPIGEMVTAAKDAAELGKTTASTPIEKMRTAIPKMSSAARKLQSAASKVPLIVKNVLDMTKRAALLLPKNQAEVEKEYWLRWVAQLDNSEKSKLEQSKVRKHLETIGVWSQLGIHNPDSEHEDNVAIWSARAQQKILAHRGEVMTKGSNLEEGMGIFGGFNAKVSLSGVGNVAAEWAGTGGGDRAIIVGARAVAQSTSPIDAAAMKAADDKVAFLIRHGMVCAQLEPLAETKVDKDPDDDSYVVTTPNPN